ncbi:hypothetical protein SERLA73DRAFT_159370 [Serpula lacrymans var. lacrymans S7.3]|uniref:RlpA-like protein double-psi beta-barrel domain-containing protein n=2 Tax=Serpula lacrymans var. lacrymans TaxID=341189 RepID=F8PRP7_SERL3|nr:uncharacterized protein SERLADRAFT_355165 [Serpula lacrymans var. lacrymans S7.9]EGO00617.1 hypothetical protein SERLA73DRAFT_159370 [Serpula lacrymans var. lacrymans S7.3]EGO26173.1 hypothetical protein SERLADRAFT_355165 [Serpula lacrymans var. lacrymans S7.9]
MWSFKTCLVLFSLTLSAAALTTPHISRNIYKRHHVLDTSLQASAPETQALEVRGAPSFLTGQQTGQGTYYAAGLGACGITNTDADYICAVSHELFDQFPGYDGQDPNTNPVCGLKITLSYQGKSVTVEVTDRCTGCDMTSIDLTPTAFGQLADLGVGRLWGMTWTWNSLPTLG